MYVVVELVVVDVVVGDVIFEAVVVAFDYLMVLFETDVVVTAGETVPFAVSVATYVVLADCTDELVAVVLDELAVTADVVDDELLTVTGAVVSFVSDVELVIDVAVEVGDAVLVVNPAVVFEVVLVVDVVFVLVKDVELTLVGVAVVLPVDNVPVATTLELFVVLFKTVAEPVLSTDVPLTLPDELLPFAITPPVDTFAVPLAAPDDTGLTVVLPQATPEGTPLTDTLGLAKPALLTVFTPLTVFAVFTAPVCPCPPRIPVTNITPSAAPATRSATVGIHQNWEHQVGVLQSPCSAILAAGRSISSLNTLCWLYSPREYRVTGIPSPVSRAVTACPKACSPQTGNWIG